jgi:RNA polymerase sigma-32 factor
MLERGPTNVAFYVEQSRRSPRLTPEQEIELARRWKTHGDRKAADRLVRAHLRYVVTTALRYRRYGIPVSELVAEGNFGVVLALRKFDPSRGIRFVTYAAHWVRATIMGHIVKTWSIVGGSTALRSRSFFRLRRERARLLGVLGDDERAEVELASRLGMQKERLRVLLRRLDARDQSLDAPATAHSPATSLEQLVASDDPERQFWGRHIDNEMKIAVEHALSVLDRRERFIAERRLMADSVDELSLAELGRRLGVSRERVRQLEARAKKRLRAAILARGDVPLGEWLAPRDAA